MTTITRQLQQLNAHLRGAEQCYQRNAHAVTLLAVSKAKPVSAIAQAYCAGQRHFGENYLQEALQKQTALGAFAITWHFIGPIQTNKTKLLAQHFAWVHSVDSLKVAQRLNNQRPCQLPPLNICVQVNISAEPTKSGVLLKDLAALVEPILLLPRLKLRGVMAIPAPCSDFAGQREPYRLLVNAVNLLNLPQLDTFSLGMSADLDAAIAEGSTMVRIGTALFGER